MVPPNKLKSENLNGTKSDSGSSYLVESASFAEVVVLASGYLNPEVYRDESINQRNFFSSF